MVEMNEFERAVADELRRDAGPVLPVDDRAVYESVSVHGRSRWNAPVLRFTTYLAAGLIVALFGGFLLVGVVTQPPDGIPVAPGGSASPEGTPSVGPTQAPMNEDRAAPDPSSSPKENDVNLKTPLATALAVGMLASPAAGQVDAPADLMEPAQVTGTSSFPVDQGMGSRQTIDGVLHATNAYLVRDWEASDPRLTGRHTTLYDFMDFDAKMMVAGGTVRHENDEGSWSGTASYMGGEGLGSTATYIMAGEGAYEGLTAYVVIDEETSPVTFSAAIFPGDMPVRGASD